MSNGSPAPGRLDSLKGKRSSLSGTKPGGSALRFKPKAVARRSKEERDADAPVVVPEASAVPARTGSLRGRGSSRGAKSTRGGISARNAGTHIVSSGPLSSGFVTMDHSRSDKKPSPSPAPEFLKSLKLRTSASPAASSTYPSDDEDGIVEGDTKINMSQAYAFDDEQTELFPVRAARVDADTEVAPTLPTTKQERDPSVKSEDETSIPEVGPLKVDPPAKEQSTQEQTRLAEDHDKLRELLESRESVDVDVDGDAEMDAKAAVPENKYLFFQLPKLLPDFKRAEDVKGDGVSEEKAPHQQDNLDGQVGSLRYHRSGKITMKLGNIVFDVTRGGSTQFLQDLIHIKDGSGSATTKEDDMVVIEDDGKVAESDPEIYHLGQIMEKIVVTPKVDGKLI